MEPNTARRQARARTVSLALVACALIAAFAACGSKSDADLARDWLAKGLKAHAAGKLPEAAKDYRETLVYDSTNKFAYFNLGVIEQAANQPKLAALNYRIALESDPRFSPALFNLAILVTQEDPEQAVDVYKQLIAAEPGNASAHLNLGFLYKQLGRGRDADKEFKRATDLDPSLENRVKGQQSVAPRSQGGG